MRTISATEFKAKCLAILEEVNRTQEAVMVLKRGKPVAQVVPPLVGGETYAQQALFGTVEILGDVLSPVLNPETWEAEARRS